MHSTGDESPHGKADTVSLNNNKEINNKSTQNHSLETCYLRIMKM